MADQIISLIYATIDELNELRADDESIPKELETPLFGEKGYLDSLGLVNLIATLEEKLEDELDLEITLVSNEVLCQQDSPFSSIQSLLNHVTSLSEK